ncbi:caldesmon isoform X1 [Xenopus laevis]|uniref:Caldesmon isoform X1 n=1 Tax=Xenopus laevis TaxID=8355 RepID=A0A8J1MQ92_XENLA|nr:caldesmon isoform X1 [Xenopus laevis]
MVSCMYSCVEYHAPFLGSYKDYVSFPSSPLSRTLGKRITYTEAADMLSRSQYLVNLSKLTYQRNDDDDEEAARERRRRARQERQSLQKDYVGDGTEVNSQNSVTTETTRTSTNTSTDISLDDEAALLERLAKREERRQQRLKEALERQKEFDPTITDETLSSSKYNRNGQHEVEENHISAKEDDSVTHRSQYEVEETEIVTTSYQKNDSRKEVQEEVQTEKTEEKEEEPVETQQENLIKNNQVEVTFELKSSDHEARVINLEISVDRGESELREDDERKAEEKRIEEEARREAVERERAEAERKSAEERERLEAERLATEEKERLEAERKAAEEERERCEAEAKREAEQREKEQAEAEERERQRQQEESKLAEESAEAERKAQEERERVLAEKKKAEEEKLRLEAEQSKAAEEKKKAEEKRLEEARERKKAEEKKAAEERERKKAEEKKAAEEKDRKKAEEEKARLEAKKKEEKQDKKDKTQPAFLRKQGEDKEAKVDSKMDKITDEKPRAGFRKEEVKEEKAKGQKEDLKASWERKKDIPETKAHNGESGHERAPQKLKQLEKFGGTKSHPTPDETDSVSKIEADKRLDDLRRRRGETESGEFDKLKQKQQEAAVELEELKKKREERRKIMEEEEQRKKQEEAERKTKEEEEKKRLKEEIEKRRAEAAEKRKNMPEDGLSEEKKPFKCFTPKGSSFKIEERAEFLNKSAQKSSKSTQSAAAVSKIDSRLEQYTSAIGSNKSAKPSKTAPSDLPLPADGIRNIKSMWEKGNVFSSPSGALSPNKETANIKVGVSSRINEWLTKTPETNKATPSKPSDLKPGDVSGKRNIWEKPEEKPGSPTKV